MLSTYLVRRLLQSGTAVLVMSAIVFFGVHVVGDPVHMLVSPDADQTEIERLTRGFGLDRPILEQYAIFLLNLTKGELGRSFVFGEPALGLILQRMPATLELAIAALLIAVFLGVPLGLFAGLHARRPVSKAIMAGSVLGFSLPTFWVGMMMIMIFSVWLGLLPATGRGPTVDILGIDLSIFTAEGLRHLLMPALNLALLKISLIIRLTEAGTRSVINLGFVKFAKVKGLTPKRIILVHILPHVLIPVVTVLGLEFGSLIAFSVVTETIFAWPGMGKLLIDSILNLDRPVVVVYLMVIVFLFVLINLLVDLLYAALDPRVRVGDRRM